MEANKQCKRMRYDINAGAGEVDIRPSLSSTDACGSETEKQLFYDSVVQSTRTLLKKAQKACTIEPSPDNL